MPTELIGYLASALVVTSLTMRSILRLRLISLAGSATFLVYGILIESVPIIVTNVAILSINVWFLRKEFLVRGSRSSDLGVSRIRADSPFLRDFVDYHHDDILRFQPDFTLPTGDDVVALMLTRDAAPAGLVIGHLHGSRLDIDLDYVLREHRDSRLGVWLYGPGADVFRSLGVTSIRAIALTDAHDKYLRRAGFEAPVGSVTGEFELGL